MGSVHEYVDIPLADELECIVVHGSSDQPPAIGTMASKLRASMKRLTSLKEGGSEKKRSTPRVIKRSASSAEIGLRGLRFLDKTAGGKDSEAWRAVEKRFDQLAAAGGRLARESFGRCIGMADSKEFAGELFDALARRRNLDPANGVTKDELKEFWEEITNQNFDSRLQIFFEMCDKNGDGKLSEDEVKEVIVLSASANKLAKLKANAATYAALIMEELDPDHLGYIEVLKHIFL